MERCPYCGAVTASQALHVFSCPKCAVPEDKPDAGPPSGYLEVGVTDDAEVCINLPATPDMDKGSHVIFSIAQARALAEKLVKHAKTAERMLERKSKSKSKSKGGTAK